MLWGQIGYISGNHLDRFSLNLSKQSLNVPGHQIQNIPQCPTQPHK